MTRSPHLRAAAAALTLALASLPLHAQQTYETPETRASALAPAELLERRGFPGRPERGLGRADAALHHQFQVRQLAGHRARDARRARVRDSRIRPARQGQQVRCLRLRARQRGGPADQGRRRPDHQSGGHGRQPLLRHRQHGQPRGTNGGERGPECERWSRAGSQGHRQSGADRPGNRAAGQHQRPVRLQRGAPRLGEEGQDRSLHVECRAFGQARRRRAGVVPRRLRRGRHARHRDRAGALRDRRLRAGQAGGLPVPAGRRRNAQRGAAQGDGHRRPAGARFLPQPLFHAHAADRPGGRARFARQCRRPRRRHPVRDQRGDRKCRRAMSSAR